jgi:hypothetical protein
MADDGFTPEQAILVARAAGLDTSDLEAQAKSPDSAPTEELVKRIEELEAKLESAQPKPADPASQYASALHKAQSRWMTLGDSTGGPDGEAA